MKDLLILFVLMFFVALGGMEDLSENKKAGIEDNDMSHFEHSNVVIRTLERRDTYNYEEL